MEALWRILSEVYASLKGIIRYKETAFWVIVFPMIFYGLMVAIWGNPNPPTVTVGVCNADGLQGSSTIGDALVEAMKSTGFMKLKMYGSPESLREAVARGWVDAGVVIPANFTESIMRGAGAEVIVYYTRASWGDFAHSILSGFLHEFSDGVRERVVNTSITYIEEYAANASWGPWNFTEEAVRWLRFIADPIRVNESGVVPSLLATPAGVRAYYALSMIGVEALFIGLFTGASAVAERRKSGVLTVILASPLRDWELLASDTLAGLAAIGISGLAVTSLSLAMGARYSVSPGVLALSLGLMIVGAVFTIGLGLLLSLAARTPEGVNVIVNAIAFPVMFAGGIVIPPEVLPAPLKAFARAWPLSRALDAARKLLLSQATPTEAIAAALPAALAAVAVYALGAVAYKKLMARVVEYH